MREVSPKTASVIYFIVTPILAVTGYMSQILLMLYFTILGIISIYLTIFEN